LTVAGDSRLSVGDVTAFLFLIIKFTFVIYQEDVSWRREDFLLFCRKTLAHLFSTFSLSRLSLTAEKLKIKIKKK
jgi:hypothetical protein